ncbi:MAG: M48 family metalloprotease [Ilumatobacteraceae bacterium]
MTMQSTPTPPPPGGRQTVTPVALDRRRGWARIRAMMACFTGVAVFALSAAGLVMIAFAAAARMWSFFTHKSITDSPVWKWAPGGAGVLAVVAVVVSFGGAFWYFWRGASRQVLAEVAAVPMDRNLFPGFFNIVEALSIGVGRQMPTMYITNDPVPNAMSLRSNRGPSLVITTGCATLPRDEVEAMCAHEIGHLCALDSRWVTSGMVALARARRFGGLIVTLATLLFVLVGALAYYGDVVLWSTGLVALLLFGLGVVSKTMLRRLELSVRRHADEIADVVAVKLAKNPSSLGMVCQRLAANPARVSPAGWRSELLWFEAVESVDSVPTSDGAMTEVTQVFASTFAAVDGRSNAELTQRSIRAYAEARVPLPPRPPG